MGSARISTILAGPRSTPSRRWWVRSQPPGLRAGLRLVALLMLTLLLSDALARPAAAEPMRAAALTPLAAARQPSPAAVAPESRPTTSPLEQRLQQWPGWRLPAPLARPGRRAPGWPAWFSGEWEVQTTVEPAEAAQPGQPGPPWRARFQPDGRGGAVADRAFNAFSLGRSLLGETLLAVQDDPANPQRQLARLAGEQLLESTLIGQRGESPQPDRFLNDELTLEVLHGPGEPRVSRIETLGRWHRLEDGSIAGEQWQARYGSPAGGLSTAALSSDHWRIRLVPAPPGCDRATRTEGPAGDCR